MNLEFGLIHYMVISFIGTIFIGVCIGWVFGYSYGWSEGYNLCLYYDGIIENIDFEGLR